MAADIVVVLVVVMVAAAAAFPTVVVLLVAPLCCRHSRGSGNGSRSQSNGVLQGYRWKKLHKRFPNGTSWQQPWWRTLSGMETNGKSTCCSPDLTSFSRVLNWFTCWWRRVLHLKSPGSPFPNPVASAPSNPHHKNKPQPILPSRPILPRPYPNQST